MTTTVNKLTVLLGILTLLPALKRLFEPFRTKFYRQIKLSELPFTGFTYSLGITEALAISEDTILANHIRNHRLYQSAPLPKERAASQCILKEMP